MLKENNEIRSIISPEKKRDANVDLFSTVNQFKRTILFALPRSGTTWLSNRLAHKYDAKLIDEPFRTMFGNTENSFYHSKLLHGYDFLDQNFWKSIDVNEQESMQDLLSYLNNIDNVIVKETNNIFQIPFFKKALESYNFVFLKRHLGGVLNSLLKIQDVYTNWTFDKRIEVLHAELHKEEIRLDRLLQKETNAEIAELLSKDLNRVQEYLHIYKKAEENKIRNSSEASLLLGHLAVQSIEALSIVDRVLKYEDLVKEGIPDDLLTSFNVASYYKKPLQVDQNENYLTHSTKNMPTPYAFISTFSDEDWTVAQELLGKYQFTFFSRPKSKEVIKQNIPDLTFIPIKESVPMISNRLISQGEYIEFINALLLNGLSIEEVEKILLSQISTTHTAIKSDNGLFIAKETDKPITHISPLAALAYCKYNGYELPSLKTYEALQQKYESHIPHFKTANFGDFRKLTRIGIKKQVDGYYDLFGNAAEFCVDKEGNYHIVGGSYKDEIDRLSLSNINPTMYGLRNTEVGFRVKSGKSKNKKSASEVIQLIRNSKKSKELNVSLLLKP